MLRRDFLKLSLGGLALPDLLALRAQGALLKEMAPEQLAKAKALAKEMTEQNPKLIRNRKNPKK
jgi:hypothetical protein|tara:strand:+ start:180 stop:371 length:192 start_codon:yes stop_codon:yes gene_type:complete